jgi:chromosome segregation ATPase
VNKEDSMTQEKWTLTDEQVENITNHMDNLENLYDEYDSAVCDYNCAVETAREELTDHRDSLETAGSEFEEYAREIIDYLMAKSASLEENGFDRKHRAVSALLEKWEGVTLEVDVPEVPYLDEAEECYQRVEIDDFTLEIEVEPEPMKDKRTLAAMLLDKVALLGDERPETWSSDVVALIIDAAKEEIEQKSETNVTPPAVNVGEQEDA